MLFQRKCNSLTLLLLVAIMMIVGFGYLSLQESSLHVTQKDHEIVKRREHENVLQEQLKVVYHHTSRVEEELKKEREKHKNTLLELLDKKKQFHSNITKTKHEAWTRFNALDSDYKMLKAEHEEMKTNYLSLQAQYRRLSSDHHRLTKESRQNYNELKSSKESESMSLQDRIQELYKKNTYYYQLAEQNEGYYTKMEEYFESCKKLTSEYKDRINTYHKLLKDAQENDKINKSIPVNDSSLNLEFSKIQAERGNITIQKIVDKQKLKDMTGVKNMDVDTMPKNTGAQDTSHDTSLDSNGNNGNRRRVEGNFMIEQKNRFLRRKKTENTEEDAKLHDRYGNLITKEEEAEATTITATITTTLGQQNNNKFKSPLLPEKSNIADTMEPNSDLNETPDAKLNPVVVNGDGGGGVNAAQNIPGNQLRPPADGDPPKLDGKDPAKSNQLKPPVREERQMPHVVGDHAVRKLMPKNQLREPRQENVADRNNESDLKNKVPLVKPAPKPKPVDHNEKERMDVNKVTLEEDENGDQNLDNNAEEPEKEMGAEIDNINGEEHNNKQDSEEGLQEERVDLNGNK